MYTNYIHTDTLKKTQAHTTRTHIFKIHFIDIKPNVLH